MTEFKVSLDRYSYTSKPNSEVVSISDRIADQIKTCNSGNIKSFARQVAKEGHTFCPATFKSSADDFEKTRKRKENFEQIQLLALDFDKGISFDEVKDRAKNYDLPILFAYDTFTSRDHDKFRVVFLNDCPVTNIKTAELMLKSLTTIFPEADPQCRSPVQMYYGSNKEVVYLPMFGKIILRYVTIFAEEWYIKDRGIAEGSNVMGLLPMDIEILPPSDDRIFKLLLTFPEGKPALIDLISATLRRPVIDVIVRNNELPLGDTDEKAERLDVNCKIDDGSQVDLEMQASRIEEDSDGGHKNLKGKSIYYLCDLHSSQPSKGLRRYDNLVRTYQVTFCSYTVFPNLPDYANSFSMRHDASNGLLSDAIHVIYVELSKLGEIIRKSVDDMTDLEKWALFLQYANIPEYREAVNKVIDSKEALQMAGNLLMGVSKDERERAVYRSRRMYQTDMQSNIATAEDRGEQRKALTIASNMLKRNRPIDEIIEDTGLTREEVESLNV